MNPVVTFRRYNLTLEEAEQGLNMLFQDIEKAGFKRSDSVQREYVFLFCSQCRYNVMDTNLDLDQGWLFDKDPTQFITSL